MSDTKASLYAALAKAQAEYAPAKKSSEANAGSYKYRYATLDVVLDAITPALSENGLSRWWESGVTAENGHAIVTVRACIGHAESGQQIDAALSWPVPEDIQDFGGVLTYLRRYTMQAVAGIAPDEDDDAANVPPARKPAKPIGNQKGMDAALAKGRENRDADRPSLKEAIDALGWTVDQLRDAMMESGDVSDRSKIESHPSEWPKWALDVAWNVVDAAKANPQEEVSGIPTEQIPF